MKRILSILILAALIIGLSSCYSFKETPETDAAFSAYESAIKKTVTRMSGSVSVQTVNKDTLNNTESVGIIEYSFSTNEERKVSFERQDYTNGELVASYYGDGEKAFQMDLTTDQWIDVTKNSLPMLTHDTNYMNTLSLFRIDNGFRYSKRYLDTLTMEEGEDGEKIITFTLKGDVISDAFSYVDNKKMKREMTHQSRSYYVNAEGDLYKIVIDSSQDVSLGEKKGTLSGIITVLVDFK